MIDPVARHKVHEEFGLLDLHRKYADADFEANRLYKEVHPSRLDDEAPGYKPARDAANDAHRTWYEAFQKAEAEVERRFGPTCYTPMQEA